MDEVSHSISPHMWRYFERTLHGYTMIDVAHLRQSGLSWRAVAGHIGVDQDSLESAVDMRWIAAGDPGLPDPPARTLAPDAPERTRHRAEYTAARDQWLFSLLAGG